MADKQFENRNRGVLFPQQPKTDRHPNWAGEINVKGEEFWISAWNKQSKNGNNYKSLSVKPKEESAGRNSESWQQAKDKFSNNNAPVEQEEADTPVSLDDIPF